MRTHQIMTRRVVTVGPIVEAAGIKLQTTSADFRGRLPLFGIVSEGDFIRHAEIGTQRKPDRSPFSARTRFRRRPFRARAETQGRRGHDAAAIHLTEDASLEDIVDLMEKNNVLRSFRHRAT